MSRGAPDDRELVRRAASGDDDAFGALVRRVLPDVRRWALARTGDPDEADEVVQETLIRMHRGLAGWDGEGRLTSWLYRVLANVTIDRARAIASRRGVAGAPEAAAEVSSDPVRSIHAARMAAAVRDFFAALPERQRELIELVDHEGMRAVDVAEALGMNPVTVRAHLFKARRALRSRILERYPELTEGYEA